MREMDLKELAPEGFPGYRAYASMLDPDTPRIGAAPGAFYRDMVQLDLDGA